MAVRVVRVVRGVRGATSVGANDPSAIEEAVRELLGRLVSENQVALEEVAAAFFTSTPDLDADFPARAARQMGWGGVPLMCAQEIEVPGAPARIVRVLLLVNTALAQKDVRHVYLGEAARLRPDLAK